MNSPFQVNDISKLVSPYVASVLHIVLFVSIIFVVLTTTVLLYHWWRYADSKFMTLVTVLAYFIGSAILLFIMYASLN